MMLNKLKLPSVHVLLIVIQVQFDTDVLPKRKERRGFVFFYMTSGTFSNLTKFCACRLKVGKHPVYTY